MFNNTEITVTVTKHKSDFPMNNSVLYFLSLLAGGCSMQHFVDFEIGLFSYRVLSVETLRNGPRKVHRFDILGLALFIYLKHF